MRRLCDFGLLRAIRDRVEGSADGESSFLAAGVNIDYDAAQGKDARLDEVRDTVRNAASRLTWKGPVHVDAIERRRARVRYTGALAQLRKQHDSSRHDIRVQVRTQVFYGDLAFIFVAMRAAETDYGSGVFSAASVYDSERHQGISPGAVEMECNLIVVLAWFVEIDLFRGVDESGHPVVWDEELSLPEYTK